MLKLAGLAIIGALSAAAAARALSAFVQADPPASSQAASPVAAPAPAAANGGAASVAKGPDGHYWADATVNGHAVRFLVDTGASAVALTPDDAQRLGFFPGGLAYTYEVTTAAGPARAARVKLDDVTVASADVRDVDAYVIEKGLTTSLLGMTYLGRLSQFDATPTALILRP